MGRTLGTRLRKLRKERRWTLKEVAEKLELRGHSTYSNWEYDRTEPDQEMLSRLSRLFNVTVDYLVGRTNDPNHEMTEDARYFFDHIDLADDDFVKAIELIRVDGKPISKRHLLMLRNIVRADYEADNHDKEK